MSFDRREYRNEDWDDPGKPHWHGWLAAFILLAGLVAFLCSGLILLVRAAR